ncbi:MAG TPA: glucose-6-phosphate dehydrogenase [Bryobacteraceae bacterium]|nr:glucose-6-phosphate dehydrogenase [Bryobacteraceae bacterium]
MENPFQDPLRFGRRLPPCAIVILGATGDLSRRKLVPALYRLFVDRQLPSGFAILGTARLATNDDGFRETMREALARFSEDTPPDDSMWRAFAQGMFYLSGDMHDPEFYTRMAARLEEIATVRQTAGNVLFYLSTSPEHYETAAQGIGAAGMNHGSGWRRIVVEKPFGRDLASARRLSASLQEIFPEAAIYRIDHYLGKETVQNILAFRFGNGTFEPLWNRRYVEHVQITAAESIGVEGRGAYYDQYGALRDMIQNHLLQVMATVAMEPSSTFRAEAVRDERAKLLRSIRILQPEEVPDNSVAGQYGPARIGGEDVPGYRQERGVDAQSCTETYAALTLFAENWRWAGVPFYLRTGKRMPRQVTEIAIQYRSAPLAIFNGEETSPNLLVLRIQPEPGISLKFLSKRPGTGMMLRPVSMDFNYGSSFGERSPAAYETLLLDALEGDATLYSRQDMVEASWAVVEPVRQGWDAAALTFPNYSAGSWGPAAADAMLARRGHAWRRP